MPEYNVAEHWSGVAAKTGQRGIRGRFVAGDDAPYYRYKGRRFVETFLPQLTIEDKAVLDVGCGPGGNLALMLPRHPRRLVGCDVAPAMVTAPRENPEVEGAEVVLIEGESLPFADNEFDVSFTATVLMHNPLQRMRQTVAEMRRVTRSRIYLIEDTFPASSASSGAIEDEASTGIGEFGNVFPRSVGEYADACAKDGFVLTNTQFLNTYVSHVLFTFLKTRLDQNRTSEGQKFSQLHWGIETILQPLTRQLDRVIRRPAGELTLMRFDRDEVG